MQGAETGCQEECGLPRRFRQLGCSQSTRFTDLFEPNRVPLRRYVAAVLRNSPDVDDVVQQTALQAYVHLNQFRFEARFGSWLRSIALNEIRQLYRRESDLRNAALLSADIADGGESAQTVWERKETAAAVHRAIQQLPADQQVVITLRYLESLDLAGIAERLSISVGAVKVRLYRARSRLAREINS